MQKQFLLQKQDVAGIFFLLFLCIVKFFVTGFFTGDRFLFSADFILVNLLIAWLFRGGRFILITSLYNLVYILLLVLFSYVNVFHFSTDAIGTALRYLYLHDTRKVVLSLFQILITLLLVFIAARMYAEKKIARLHLLPLLMIWAILIGSALFIQEKSLQDHFFNRNRFNLAGVSDFGTIIHNDRQTAFSGNQRGNLSTFFEQTGKKPPFYSFANDSAEKKQMAIMLAGFSLVKDTLLGRFLLDSMHAWFDQTAFSWSFDSMPASASREEAELHQLFNASGDYHQLLLKKPSAETVFEEKKRGGFQVMAVNSSRARNGSARLIYLKAGCDSSFFMDDLVHLDYMHPDRETSLETIQDENTFDYLLGKMMKDTAQAFFGYLATANTNTPFRLFAPIKQTAEYKIFYSRFGNVYPTEILDQQFRTFMLFRYFIFQCATKGIRSVVISGDVPPDFGNADNRQQVDKTFVPVFTLKRRTDIK